MSGVCTIADLGSYLVTGHRDVMLIKSFVLVHRMLLNEYLCYPDEFCE